MPLYHCSTHLFKPGHRIAPGSWGRQVLEGGPLGHSQFYREYIFEQVRIDEFPGRPSRLAVAFAFDELSRARELASKRQDAAEQVYEVEIADDVNPFRADCLWFEVLSQQHTFVGVNDCARRYWRGGSPHSDAAIEILVPGDLVVVGRT